MTTYETAKQAYHAWRRRQRDEDDNTGPTFFWKGGHATLVRFPSGGVRRLRAGAYHIGEGFEHLQGAAYSGRVLAHRPLDCSDKRRIADYINLSRKCPAPVLP